MVVPAGAADTSSPGKMPMKRPEFLLQENLSCRRKLPPASRSISAPKALLLAARPSRMLLVLRVLLAASVLSSGQAAS